MLGNENNDNFSLLRINLNLYNTVLSCILVVTIRKLHVSVVHVPVQHKLYCKLVIVPCAKKK